MRGRSSPKRKVRTPKQDRGLQTRNKILNTAIRLFGKRGYHKTNSKEIARVAGVATGSFYTYFKDKRSLFLEVVRRFNEQGIEKVLSSVSVDDFSDLVGRDTVYKLIKLDLAVHDQSPDFHRELEGMKYSDRDVEKIHYEEEELVLRNLTALFASMQDKLRVTDIEAAAMVVRSAVEAVVHSIKIFTPRIEEERLIRELADMISSYLFK